MSTSPNALLAALRLARAMRRCPPPPPAEHPFPPAVGRLLACVSQNRKVSSRDLCDLLDLRPSSLSEMLARAEGEGLILRTVDEEDRRVQRVDLSPKGEAVLSAMQEARDRDLQAKTSCFTEEEQARFIALCDKFSDHLESLALREDFRPRHPGPHGPHGPRGPFPPEDPEGGEEGDERPAPFTIPPNKHMRC